MSKIHVSIWFCLQTILLHTNNMKNHRPSKKFAWKAEKLIFEIFFKWFYNCSSVFHDKTVYRDSLLFRFQTCEPMLLFECVYTYCICLQWNLILTPCLSICVVSFFFFFFLVLSCLSFRRLSILVFFGCFLSLCFCTGLFMRKYKLLKSTATCVRMYISILVLVVNWMYYYHKSAFDKYSSLRLYLKKERFITIFFSFAFNRERGKEMCKCRDWINSALHKCVVFRTYLVGYS